MSSETAASAGTVETVETADVPQQTVSSTAKFIASLSGSKVVVKFYTGEEYHGELACVLI